MTTNFSNSTVAFFAQAGIKALATGENLDIILNGGNPECVEYRKLCYPKLRFWLSFCFKGLEAGKITKAEMIEAATFVRSAAVQNILETRREAAQTEEANFVAEAVAEKDAAMLALSLERQKNIDAVNQLNKVSTEVSILKTELSLLEAELAESRKIELSARKSTRKYKAQNKALKAEIDGYKKSKQIVKPVLKTKSEGTVTVSV